VPYRENSMAYDETKLCRCNPPRKAHRWILWSGLDPGRRYYPCVDALVGSSIRVFFFISPIFSDSFMLAKLHRMSMAVGMLNGMMGHCRNSGVNWLVIYVMMCEGCVLPNMWRLSLNKKQEQRLGFRLWKNS
jgi:hypothetical protein